MFLYSSSRLRLENAEIVKLRQKTKKTTLAEIKTKNSNGKMMIDQSKHAILAELRTLKHLYGFWFNIGTA